MVIPRLRANIEKSALRGTFFVISLQKRIVSAMRFFYLFAYQAVTNKMQKVLQKVLQIFAYMQKKQ
jgi:hypothetical protein